MNTKRLVAVGHISPERDEIMCDPAFRDTFQDGADNAMDALPEAQDHDDWYTLGELDGDNGLSCDPTFYGCMKVVDAESYVLGWRAANKNVKEMRQITRQTDNGYVWLVKVPFERVATLMTYLDNYAEPDAWHSGNVAGLDYDSVWATGEALAAAVAAYEDAPVAKPTPEERFAAMCMAMADVDEHAEETRDLESYMDDVDWLRGGC